MGEQRSASHEGFRRSRFHVDDGRYRRVPLGFHIAMPVLLGILAMPIYPYRLGFGIEQSFQSAQHLLVVEGVGFGSHAVFTFGPLGFLAFPQLYYSTTWLLAVLTVFGLVLAASFVTFMSFRKALPSIPAAALTYLVLVFGFDQLLEREWLAEAAACLATIVCLLVVTRHVDQKTPIVPLDVTAVLFGAMSALMLLMKISAGLQVGAVSASTIWIVSSPSGKPTIQGGKTLATWLSAFLVSGLAVWLLLGQHVSDLAVYLRYSTELAAGYSGAMGFEDPARRLDIVVAAIVSGGLVGVSASRWGWKGLRNNPLIAVPLILYLFTVFKHGFVRHDRHVLVFFVTAVMPAMAFITRERLKQAILLMSVGLVMTWSIDGTSPSSANPFTHIAHAADTASLVLDGSMRKSAIDSNRTSIRQQVMLSDSTVALLSGKRVHTDPWDTGILWAYPEFEWGATPVFQTFAAYTVGLDELNAEMLRSDRAPDYILRRVIAIDERHPAFESPAYMVEMACRYEEVAVDGVWSILARTTSICRDLKVMSSTTVGFGESVEVPDASLCDGWIVLTVGGLDSVGQKLQAALYKDATYWLTFTNSEPYRLIPGTATQPHLLPDQIAPSWLGNSLVAPQSRVVIDKTDFTALTPQIVELNFSCLSTA